MKSLKLLGLTFFCSGALQAQLNFGPIIAVGADKIQSKNLQENLNYQKSIDANILDWTVIDRRRYNYSFGGFLQFKLNRNLDLYGEMTFNSFNSRFALHQAKLIYENATDYHLINNGEVETIQLRFLSPAVTGKFNFRKSGIYFLAGLRLNANITSKIVSNGLYSDEHWDNIGTQVSATSTFTSHEAKLDGYDKLSAHFTSGIGFALELYDRIFNVDVRYNLPITKSSLYTSDEEFRQTVSDNRNLLSLTGKNLAESLAPHALLNDFRLSFVQVIFSFNLKKN